MSKLNCNIVKDLLPSYIDELTSEETNKEIKEHLENCNDCTDTYKRMKGEDIPVVIPNTEEIDYLKKVKKKSTMKTIIICLATLILVAALIFVKTYFIGERISPDFINYEVTVTDNSVNLLCHSTDISKKISKVNFSEENGVLNIDVKAAPYIHFSERLCSALYTGKEDIKEIYINGRCAWYYGEQISKESAKAYETKHDYVGDAPANALTASYIGVNRQFGEIKNELQTDNEPYGWTITLSSKINTANPEQVQSTMLLDSYALIALIGNLDYVNWSYIIGDTEMTYSVTKEMADDFAGCDIKECASDIGSFNKFYSKLNLEWTSSFNLGTEEGSFGINILVNVPDKIQSLSLSYGTNGVLIGTSNCMNANGTNLAAGDTVYFEFLSDDFTSDTNLQNFEFSLHATMADGTTTVIQENIPQPAQYDWSYFYTLSENENGQLILTKN